MIVICFRYFVEKRFVLNIVIFEKKSMLLRNARKKVCFAGNLLPNPPPTPPPNPHDKYQMAAP